MPIDVGVAEEIRRVQQIDVQRVTVDPFPAIQQPSQRAMSSGSTVIPQASSIALQALTLIGDGTDAADARGDVRRLVYARPRRNASKNRGGS